MTTEVTGIFDVITLVCLLGALLEPECQRLRSRIHLRRMPALSMALSMRWLEAISVFVTLSWSSRTDAKSASFLFVHVDMTRAPRVHSDRCQHVVLFLAQGLGRTWWPLTVCMSRIPLPTVARSTYRRLGPSRGSLTKYVYVELRFASVCERHVEVNIKNASTDVDRVTIVRRSRWNSATSSASSRCVPYRRKVLALERSCLIKVACMIEGDNNPRTQDAVWAIHNTERECLLRAVMHHESSVLIRLRRGASVIQGLFEIECVTKYGTCK